ncbi:MAG: SDR family NAD(P)-dependent oxidoreductase [Myxococcota bacterium]
MTQRVAVVTGAGRGLGLATARALAERGYDVCLTARSLARAESAAAQLREDGVRLSAAALNVADAASVAAFFNDVIDETRGGRIDVLVNNAGTVFEASGPALGVSAETLMRSFENNVVGAFRMLREALPLMNKGGYGRVVNVSSGMGSLTDMGGGHPAYRMAKAAMNAMTRIFAHEAQADVLVNAVCPGWVRTDMGGPNATRSIPEGTAGIVWAATLPQSGPSGGFFRDGEPIPW